MSEIVIGTSRNGGGVLDLNSEKARIRAKRRRGNRYGEKSTSSFIIPMELVHAERIIVFDPYGNYRKALEDWRRERCGGSLKSWLSCQRL